MLNVSMWVFVSKLPPPWCWATSPTFRKNPAHSFLQRRSVMSPSRGTSCWTEGAVVTEHCAYRKRDGHTKSQRSHWRVIRFADKQLPKQSLFARWHLNGLVFTQEEGNRIRVRVSTPTLQNWDLWWRSPGPDSQPDSTMAMVYMLHLGHPSPSMQYTYKRKYFSRVICLTKRN